MKGQCWASGPKMAVLCVLLSFTATFQVNRTDVPENGRGPGLGGNSLGGARLYAGLCIKAI